MKRDTVGTNQTERRQPHAQHSEDAKPPEGASWQFYFIVIVMVIGVLGIVAKTLGIF